MQPLTPTCVWTISPQLVTALDERFGVPIDSYVNGSQVWLRDDLPDGITVEWRLHPVPGFAGPEGVGTHDLFAEVAWALAAGEDPPAPAHELWGGLEAFPAYGDEVEPAVLAERATAALGIAPDHTGLVDHGALGDEWERSGGDLSLIDALVDQLRTPLGR